MRHPSRIWDSRGRSRSLPVIFVGLVPQASAISCPTAVMEVEMVALRSVLTTVLMTVLRLVSKTVLKLVWMLIRTSGYCPRLSSVGLVETFLMLGPFSVNCVPLIQLSYSNSLFYYLRMCPPALELLGRDGLQLYIFEIPNSRKVCKPPMRNP